MIEINVYMQSIFIKFSFKWPTYKGAESAPLPVAYGGRGGTCPLEEAGDLRCPHLKIWYLLPRISPLITPLPSLYSAASLTHEKGATSVFLK